MNRTEKTSPKVGLLLAVMLLLGLTFFAFNLSPAQAATAKPATAITLVSR